MSRIRTLSSVALGAVLPSLASRTAASLTRKGVRQVSDKPGPIDPDRRGSEWREAVLWAMLAGAVGGLARLGMTTWMSRHDVGQTPDLEILDD